MVLSEEKKAEIIKILTERGAKLPCPRCGNPNFILIDGYFNQFIQPDMKDINLGGPSIPSVIIACNKCGFLSQHALGVLGLLPKEVIQK
jgi:predicted RNA-binding Zn-ribbon protein involved in translation (DUF1610 family)